MREVIIKELLVWMLRLNILTSVDRIFWIEQCSADSYVFNFIYNPDHRFEVKNTSCSGWCYAYLDEAINQKFKNVLLQIDSQERV